MMKKIILYLLALIVFTSCNKERSIHVKAINPVTNEPYSDLRVVITSSKTGFDGEVVKTVYDGNLNSDGEAIINLKIKKNRSYAIRCEQPSNVCYTKKLQYYYTVHDEKNPSFLFEYAECAHLKLKIENVNCEGTDDNFKLYHEGSDVGYLELGNEPIKEGGGCYDFNPSHFSKVPIGRRFYKWEITRSGITEIFNDTIYLVENEYKTYEINY